MVCEVFEADLVKSSLELLFHVNFYRIGSLVRLLLVLNESFQLEGKEKYLRRWFGIEKIYPNRCPNRFQPFKMAAAQIGRFGPEMNVYATYNYTSIL